MSLIPMPATREEWLANRTRYVGASEVAALFGVEAAYAKSAYALWHVKAGRAPEPDVASPRAAWGLKMEEVIAMAAGEERGWTVARGRYAICDDTAGMAASLDFEVLDGDVRGPGVLETKNVDWLVHRRSWTDGEPPLPILLQLQHQLACTGYQWGAVAALVGGNDLRVYAYEARPTLTADIKRRVTEFWQSIRDKRPPPIGGSESDTAVLRSLYPEPVDDAIDMDGSNEWPEAVEQFIAAGEAKKAAEKAYDTTKNRVAALLGHHKRGWGGGHSVNVAVTPAKPNRLAQPGEVINGRAESRRYTASRKERTRHDTG